MFAELLSHSEEIIFLEAIDQYFELNAKSEDSPKEESDEYIEKSDISNILDEENDSIQKNSDQNPNNIKSVVTPQKYLLLNEFIIINTKFIDELKMNIYESYKSQVENV